MSVEGETHWLILDNLFWVVGNGECVKTIEDCWVPKIGKLKDVPIREGIDTNQIPTLVEIFIRKNTT